MVSRGRGRPPHPDVLTPAEWGVLEMWRHGLGRSAIAERRGISQYAVRYHLRNIAGKLGVEHYSELRHWPGFAATSLRKEQSPMATTTKLELGQLGQVSLLSKDAAAAASLAISDTWPSWPRSSLRLVVVAIGDRSFRRLLPANPGQWRSSE